ncbi:MAG: DUF6115 domain-containing protein [Lachnospiraceae bacterium]|nr:DUF6115 domain-containing protein [Lachnospiraceae bacterium]
MTGMEIALLILGIIVFIASFIVPETMYTPDEETVKLSEDKINEMVDGKIRDAKDQIQDTIDETITYAMEKAERSLERVSNEKITAVSEFSETVLSDINKNHQEVMFMYDMLHDKQKNLRETVIQADKTNAMAKETKTELELVTKQLQEETKAEETMEQTMDEDVDNQFETINLVKEVIEPKTPKKTRKTSKSTSAKTGKIIEPASMPVIGDAETESINNNDRILELHKKGKSNIAIAKELGLGVGEVNLVIDLFEVM